MNRTHLIIEALLFVIVVSLAAIAWWQHEQNEDLEGRVDRLAAQVEHLDRTPSDRARARTRVLRDSESRAERSREAPNSDIRELPDRPWRERVDQDGREPVIDEEELFDIDDPEIRMKLRDVIAEEREYAREQRWARRQERQEERIRERVKKIADATDMDSGTTTRVEDMMVVELAEVTDVFRKAREDGSWRDAREKIEAIRKQTNEDARALLSDEEYAEYDKMRQEERERWGRGGRRDRDDDDDKDDQNEEKER